MLKLNLKYQLLFCAVLFFIKLPAQQDAKSVGFKTTYHYGFIAPHREVVNEIIEGHTQVVELSLFKRINEDKLWANFYNLPKVGISLLYFDLANKEQLGKSIGILPYFSFIKGKKKITWENKFGVGVGYIEKPYNRRDNPQNLVIGSTFNALIYTNTQLNFKISNQLSSSLGLSLIHFSNAAFTMPNLGINIVSVNMGMAYHFGEDIIRSEKEIPKRERTWSKNVIVGFGLKEIPPVESKKYMITTTSFNMMKIRSDKASFGAGVDLFYNSSLTDLLAENEPYVKSNKDNVRLGLSLIYSLDYGRISTIMEMGVYLYNKEDSKGDLYNRFQLRYHTNKKIFVNLGLKTHLAVADYIELGLGYQLK